MSAFRSFLLEVPWTLRVSEIGRRMSSSGPTFHVVLVEPEIPPNTGSVGRLCLGTRARLHLVGPLGFALDDRAVRRAGLDYWQHVDCHQWESLDVFLSALPHDARTFFLSTKATRAHWDVKFERGDWLFFGCETRGLPESLLEQHRGSMLRVPMCRDSTRSLNLATSVAIVLYEGLRQIDGGSDGNLT